MRLTNEQREEVVERLRCAADDFVMGDPSPWGLWFYDLDYKDPMYRMATKAWSAAYNPWCGKADKSTHQHWWALITLEAAALIEEGWTP